MAEHTRNSAAIAVKPTYTQHSTVGILLRSNLPYPVVEPQYGHNKLLAEEFLDVCLLTKVHAELVDDNLEEWILKFECNSQETIIHLKLSGGNEHVRYFNSRSFEQLKKLKELIDIAWCNCDTIYQFVLIIHFILKSRKTIEVQKNTLIGNIMNLKRT